MKRRDLIRELERAGCEFVRAGGRHDVYRNPAARRQAPIPRHRDIPDTLCEVIRKQLGLSGAGASPPPVADAPDKPPVDPTSTP